MSLESTSLGHVVSIATRQSITPPEMEKATKGPIELKMRAKVNSLQGSSYPDTFDWSVYDKISARFGDAPPRGGVVFNTGLKLVNHHSSCSKCHYALEIDSYGRGCVHNCVFCYAKDQLSAHGYWNRPMPFPVNLAEVRKVFYTVFETSKPSKWREILEMRVPLRIGSMSDSFMWMDRKYKVSQELLRILNFYDYPHIIFTRSDLIAEDEYIRILRSDLAAVQFSISGGNEALTRKIEQGAPTVERRLKALEKLANEKIWTTVRINPLFPIYPDGYYTDRRSIADRFPDVDAMPKLELFDWDFISQLKSAKVPSVLAGFVRLSSNSLKSMSDAVGFDLRTFYKPENLKGYSDRKYSDSEIAYYYKRIQNECAKNGIRFNTCYIGNGEKDYFQYQSLWTNRADCCDARGNVPAFKSSSQEIPWDTRVKQASVKQDAESSCLKEIENEELYAHLTQGIVRPGLRVLPGAKVLDLDSSHVTT